MTFLDYLCERKQLEEGSKEWQNYIAECLTHWDENKKEITSFFDTKHLVFIPFNELEFTPFNNIPKFLAILPTIASLEYYMDAIGIKYQFVSPQTSFISSNSDEEKSGYLVTSPF